MIDSNLPPLALKVSPRGTPSITTSDFSSQPENGVASIYVPLIPGFCVGAGTARTDAKQAKNTRRRASILVGWCEELGATNKRRALFILWGVFNDSSTSFHAPHGLLRPAFRRTPITLPQRSDLANFQEKPMMSWDSTMSSTNLNGRIEAHMYSAAEATTRL